MLRVKVELDRSPLRYTFVSHRPDVNKPGVGSAGIGDPIVAMTDEHGWADFPDLPASAKGDFVVHAHNLAVRMLDGKNAGVGEIALRFRNKGDRAKLNISPKNKDQFPHYRIMDRCYEVYETVFQPVAPFSGKSRGAFPHGGADKPAHWHRRNAKVDCRFPEVLVPGKLPWVQPQSVTSGVPLMHIKGPSQDRRLFGSGRTPATTLAHEYAHAVHFSLLPSMKRWELAAKYALWIGKELANGRSGTHRTDKKTSPLIAFIEAIGIFSQRFWMYATEVRPDLSGRELRAAFVADELSEQPSLAKVLPGYAPIATLRADGTVKPRLKGSSTEGAVYGAIFLDFAHRTDLATAVNTYLRCQAFDTAGWKRHASSTRKNKFKAEVDAVARTWRV